VALAAAIGAEVVARAVGFWDARVVGGKHRTWRVLSSTKTLGAERNGAGRDRPRRLSARPEPLEEGFVRSAVSPHLAPLSGKRAEPRAGSPRAVPPEREARRKDGA
jgi:hypothetical protein